MCIRDSYKANQSYDITLHILTPNSDEAADEPTMRMLSGQSRCVLVVLPNDRTFLDEIRSALKIEKFIRFDAANAVTKFEQIKEAKKVEMRERSASARLFLTEAMREAAIYVNGDRAQSSAKEISSRINDALGKLVAGVYHKLPYIDTAMGENDIRKLFREQNQQLTLNPGAAAANELAHVSYTHLDVYKRQLLTRSHTNTVNPFSLSPQCGRPRCRRYR